MRNEKTQKKNWKDGKCERISFYSSNCQLPAPEALTAKGAPSWQLGPSLGPATISLLPPFRLALGWSKNSHVSLHSRHSGSCGKCAWNLSSTRNQPRRLKPKQEPDPEPEPESELKPKQKPNLAKNITSFWVVSSFVAFFYFIFWGFVRARSCDSNCVSLGLLGPIVELFLEQFYN